MDSLLDGLTPVPEEQPTDIDPDAEVMQVRINYVSGAFLQSWYSVFQTTTHKLTGKVMELDWKVAQVHPSAQGQVSYPHHINVDAIESIWVIQTKPASQLYSESMTVT